MRGEKGKNDLPKKGFDGFEIDRKTFRLLGGDQPELGEGGQKGR